jgi:hypothetical protein
MMRIQNGFLMVLALALAALSAVGSVYTDPYQHASQSQVSGFDALAHDLFDDLVGPGNDQDLAK